MGVAMELMSNVLLDGVQDGAWVQPMLTAVGGDDAVCGCELVRWC